MNFNDVFVIGLILILLIGVFLFFFLTIYQRKMMAYQKRLQELERERQEEILNSVIMVQERVQKRISEELHDNFGQLLSTIKLNVLRLEDKPENSQEIITQTAHLLDLSVNDIRQISRALSPSVLVDYGLITAVEQMAGMVEDKYRVTLDLQEELPDIHEDKQLSLYRIIQELLNNTIKHANATAIDVSIKVDNDHLDLNYKDNGDGFLMESDGVRKGLGLKNIESRMSTLKGNVHYKSEPGMGFVARVKIPIAENY